MRQNRADVQRAFQICEQRIAAHGLKMKLVDAEYTLDRGKLVFYFTADNRVDFRELVKDLAAQFHTASNCARSACGDESKMLGGLGLCGQPLLLQPLSEEFPAGFHQDGQGTGPQPQPRQDQRRLRPLMCCLAMSRRATSISIP